MAYSHNWRPLEVTPWSAGTDASPDGLIRYLRTIADLSGLLAKEKAIVFSGFAVTRTVLGSLVDILLPVSTVASHRFVRTEQAPARTLPSANEANTPDPPPERLLLFAEQSAVRGGAILLTDGARLFASLDDAVRKAFAEGVRYTENLHDGLGLGESWQDRFKTTSRHTVEALLDEAGIAWRWTPDGLRIAYLRSTTARHPETGEEAWFDHIGYWHPAIASVELPASLIRADELPSSLTHADGSPIAADHLMHIRERAWQSTIELLLRSGDLMLADNLLLAHGRRPFRGRRRVLLVVPHRSAILCRPHNISSRPALCATPKRQRRRALSLG